MIVPNNEFATTPFTNLTYNDPQRISYEFGTGSGDDIDVATDGIRTVAVDIAAIPDDPEPSVSVSGLADSAVLLSAQVWFAKSDRNHRESIESEFIRRVNEQCATAGIDLSTTTQHSVTGELIPVDRPDDSASAR